MNPLIGADWKPTVPGSKFRPATREMRIAELPKSLRPGRAQDSGDRRAAILISSRPFHPGCQSAGAFGLASPLSQRNSRGEGEIITAHARKDSRGAYVFGDVRKQYGAGWVTAAWSHVDVIVLDSKKPTSPKPCDEILSFDGARDPTRNKGTL